MARELRLTRFERRQAILNAFPTPSVRVRVSPYATPARQLGTQTTRPDEDDDLLSARGILYSALLGIGLWALIGLIAWFIAR